MPQISFPRPWVTSPTARKSSAFSLGEGGRLAGRAGDHDRVGSGVEQVRGQTLRAVHVQRVVLFAERGHHRRDERTEPAGHASSFATEAVDPDGPMLAPDAAHLHQDRRRRHHGPPVRGPDLQGRPGHRGLRHDRRGGRRPRARALALRRTRSSAGHPDAAARAVRGRRRPRDEPRRSARSSIPGSRSSRRRWCAGSRDGSTTSSKSGHSREVFIVPGANAGSAALDLARSIVRRAERRVVELERPSEGEPGDPPLPEPALGPDLRPRPVASGRGRARQPRTLMNRLDARAQAVGAGAMAP